MKHLKEIFSYTLFESFMDDINNEIINESLQCKILLQLAKQLKPFGKKNGGNYWNNKSFSGIFGCLPVKWDEITDDDFEKYKAGDKAGIKRARAIRADGDKHLEAIVVFPNEDGETFDSMVCWRGYINFKEHKWDFETHDYTKIEPSKDFSDYKQKWVKEDCEKRDFYILDYSKFETYKIHIDRNSSKNGMVLQGDPYYYEKLAKENRERYEKILAKRKAERAAKNDTISDDVKTIIDELMTISATAAKNPDKYVDAEYEIGWAIEMVYSTKRYEKGVSHGTNGLLYLYKNYITQHLSMAKNGGYNFQRNTQDNYKKEIETVIEDLKKRIERIKEKIK